MYGPSETPISRAFPLIDLSSFVLTLWWFLLPYSPLPSPVHPLNTSLPFIFLLSLFYHPLNTAHMSNTLHSPMSLYKPFSVSFVYIVCSRMSVFLHFPLSQFSFFFLLSNSLSIYLLSLISLSLLHLSPPSLLRYLSIYLSSPFLTPTYNPLSPIVVSPTLVISILFDHFSKLVTLSSPPLFCLY